jgi:hypothetical protein
MDVDARFRVGVVAARTAARSDGDELFRTINGQEGGTAGIAKASPGAGIAEFEDVTRRLRHLCEALPLGRERGRRIDPEANQSHLLSDRYAEERRDDRHGRCGRDLAQMDECQVGHSLDGIVLWVHRRAGQWELEVRRPRDLKARSVRRRFYDAMGGRENDEGRNERPGAHDGAPLHESHDGLVALVRSAANEGRRRRFRRFSAYTDLDRCGTCGAQNQRAQGERGKGCDVGARQSQQHGFVGWTAPREIRRIIKNRAGHFCDRLAGARSEG